MYITQYSAVDAALGYLYQIRLALLETLQRLHKVQNFQVSIETLDDVAFENLAGDPTDLLQTKHHFNAAGNLSDASPDLWKTLRIWVDGINSEAISIDTNLFLITTGIASPESAAYYLCRSPNRNIQTAEAILTATAQSSINTVNKKAYKAYLGKPVADRKKMLDRIYIVDSAPMIDDLDQKLKDEIYWTTNRNHHNSFLERLEGWWYRRVLLQLTSSGGQERIDANELEFKIADLREQFESESLPIDEDLLDFTLDDNTDNAYPNFIFVQQIQLIDAGKKRIAAAIRDYYRAFEQRSRWLRNDLIMDLELKKYEKHLTEEWEIVFEAMRDELGDQATEQAKKTAARSVLSWAERVTLPIRPNVSTPFVTRGSLHLLADEKQVGWHPDFIEKLSGVLSMDTEL